MADPPVTARLLLALLALAALPSTAQAANVRFEFLEENEDRFDVTTDYSLSVSARRGERNRISLRLRGDVYDVRDLGGARLSSGSQECSRVSRSRLLCEYDGPLDRIVVTLGDRDDRATVLGATYPAPVHVLGGAGRDRVRTSAAGTGDGGTGDDRLEGAGSFGPGDLLLAGGAGNDRLLGGRGAQTLVGGTGRDFLQGGSGDDRLKVSDGARARVRDTADGGPGADVASYEGRHAPVRLALGGRVTGSEDRVRGVEGLEGGAGDDVLTGTDGPNLLDGLEGSDRLEGRGGADTLRSGSGGAAGKDVMDGGGGDDVLTPDPFPSVDGPVAFGVVCGEGADRVTQSSAFVLVGGDCEMLDPEGPALAQVPVPDALPDARLRFRVRCRRSSPCSNRRLVLRTAPQLAASPRPELARAPVPAVAGGQEATVEIARPPAERVVVEVVDQFGGLELLALSWQVALPPG